MCAQIEDILVDALSDFFATVGLGKTRKALKKETKRSHREKLTPPFQLAPLFNKLVEAYKFENEQAVEETSTPKKKRKKETAELPTPKKKHRGAEESEEELKTSSVESAESPKNDLESQCKYEFPSVSSPPNFAGNSGTKPGPIQRIDASISNNADPEFLKLATSTVALDAFSSSAAGDLKKVRGAEFRKLMMKKKKSNWVGSGEISTEVRSYIFPD